MGGREERSSQLFERVAQVIKKKSNSNSDEDSWQGVGYSKVTNELLRSALETRFKLKLEA